MKLASIVIAGLSLAATALPTLAFDLSSPDVKAGGSIPQTFAFNNFGCTGNNISPALKWSDAPAGTKSFALMVHDPDAKTGGAGFWHWIVTNIPATATELTQNAGKADGSLLPKGAALVASDFGSQAYGGPCPPQGDAAHHYNFTLYALDVEKLPVPENPTASLAGFVVNGHAFGKAMFSATYGR